MVLTEIDHVAIAVNDLEGGDRLLPRRRSAARSSTARSSRRDGVEEALLKVADSYVQLLTPTRDDSPVAKYLASKGEGLHHVGYRVDDCAAALEVGEGARLTVSSTSRRVPAVGERPSRSCTRRRAFGTLIELVQE